MTLYDDAFEASETQASLIDLISFIFIAQINTTGVDHCALQSRKLKYKIKKKKQ